MKKTTLLVTLLVFVFAVGTVFAAQTTERQLNNGITYFGPAPAAAPDTVPAEKEETKTAFNGITYFGAEQTKSAAKGSAAGGSAGKPEAEKKTYNGITAF